MRMRWPWLREPKLTVVEAACPRCGCLDADLSHGNPLEVGVKCWDCGTVYDSQGNVIRKAEGMGLTDDRNDPRLNVVGPDGMNEAYLVLSEEERRKGFVRPVRTAYVHVGRSVCGTVDEDLWARIESGESSIVPPEGTVAYVCADLPGHEGECCDHSMPLTQPQLDELEKHGKVGGCGTRTTMGLALAETYARQPDFYGATFCCGCKRHPRVGAMGEFVWAGPDGEPLPLWVGT